MYEIEAKIKVDCKELDRILEKLLSSGAKIAGVHEERDIYFQHPCRDFLETDEALRVRVVDDFIQSLTYKGPRIENNASSIKKREEIIAEIKSGDINTMLERLGFRPVVTVLKERTYVELQGATITLDRVHDLGCFVEVEGASSEDIDRVIRKIGLRGEYIEETYAEMIARLKGLI